MAAGIDPTFYRSPAEATAAPAERLADAAADDPAVRDRDARTPAATPADMHPIVAHHATADLKKYLYGDQVGTTGLTYITNNIQPTQQPKVFDTLAEVSAALEAHRIDALITDTPTAQYMASAQLKHAVLVAQFPSVGEHYGLLFRLGNPLVSCVNKAIATLKSNGTLQQLQQKYLQVYLTFPTIQP